MYELYYQRGLVSKSLYDDWLMFNCNTSEGYHGDNDHTILCLDIEGFMMLKAGYYKINPYALGYPVCVENDKRFTDRGITSLHSPQAEALLTMLNPNLHEHNILRAQYEPCAESYLTTYLNRADVQEAIHANTELNRPWEVCNHGINLSWPLKDRYEVQMQHYVELLHGEYDLNMLVFSGDDDSVCATTGTQAWIYDLGIDVDDDHWWDNWHVDEQLAGYIVRFNVDPKAGSFRFATVHGAGHEVPAYKPKEAFDLWERFLTQNWQVEYSPGSSSVPNDADPQILLVEEVLEAKIRQGVVEAVSM
uniref:Carboxypeptidase n=1 Tax=Leptocylindrus danicus TaxID=163516 RepID=A0A7S2NXB3_9STRA